MGFFAVLGLGLLVIAVACILEGQREAGWSILGLLAFAAVVAYFTS